MERLATGLRHSPSVVVAKINAAAPEARSFLTSAFPGLIDRLPAVLLYPEAATGFIRLKGERRAGKEGVQE